MYFSLCAGVRRFFQFKFYINKLYTNILPRFERIRKMNSPKEASGSDKSLMDGTFCTDPKDLEDGVESSSLSSKISCLSRGTLLATGSSF